jgi:hypothetical protein
LASTASILVVCGIALFVGGGSTLAVLHHECVFAPSVSSENAALDTAYVAALSQFSNEFYDAAGAFVPWPCCAINFQTAVRLRADLAYQ